MTKRLLRAAAVAAALAGSAACGESREAFGDPIVVAPEDLETWVWVDVEGMRCADGSPSGVLVNLTDRSRELVIYFQGGGACWSALTCAVQSAELAPMQPDPLAQFMADPEHAQSGIFVRDDLANPMRDSNFVFVPYCTGDGHLGDRITEYGPVGTIHHVGYANVTAALERIVPTFVDAERILVGGFSAGGMGATGNYHQIASAFESIGLGPVALLNDAGPILRAPYLSEGAQGTLRDAWGLERTLDPWCPSCATEGMHEVYRRQAELHPAMRSALVCAYDDAVVRLMYAALLSPLEGGAEEEGLLDLAAWRDDVASAIAPSELREFYYPGTRHGATSQVPLAETPGLAPFLAGLFEGQGEFESVRP